MKTLDNLEVGDILIDHYNKERFVMGVAGKIVYLCDDETEATDSDCASYYTVLELKNERYAIKGQEEKKKYTLVSECCGSDIGTFSNATSGSRGYSCRKCGRYSYVQVKEN